MRSSWKVFEEADVAARTAHATRITAIAGLLETYPQPSLVGMISTRSQVSAQTARAWVREAAQLGERPDLASACGRGELSQDQAGALRVLAPAG